jgi:hypothetical protein
LPEARERLEQAIRSDSDMVNARREHLERWWQFWNRRDELNKALSTLKRYIGCSRVSRRPVMVFLSTDVCPSDLVQTFALDDDYSFGILQSTLHFEWFKTSSRLKVESDLRYSVRDIFDTFPWPQAPNVDGVRKVAAAAQLVRAARVDMLGVIQGGLRELYKLIELPGSNPLKLAHCMLDAAVRECYGMPPDISMLDYLLGLNGSIAAAIRRGDQVTGPGLPNQLAGMVPESSDCYR